MNYKLEKFWNVTDLAFNSKEVIMNYKLEKFWNTPNGMRIKAGITWTINLKSFEILL